MTMTKVTDIFRQWRANRTRLLRVSFGLILAGFAFGYSGGLENDMFSIGVAFVLWGVAGVLSLMIKT